MVEPTALKAIYYGEDIHVFGTKEGYPKLDTSYILSGLYSCPVNSPNCCSSCPTLISYKKKKFHPFNFTKLLGTGGFASVYEGDWNNTKSAFKVIPIKKDGNEYSTDSSGPYEFWMQVNDYLTQTILNSNILIKQVCYEQNAS